MVTEKGLSIIEIIFSIGVTVLVITGVVSLMVQSTGLKTDASQREKATEVAQKVIEELVDKKNNERDSFWVLNEVSGATFPEIKNYTYDVGYSRAIGIGCSDLPSPATCVYAVINIGWGDSQTLTVQRFFSKFY